MYNSVEMTILIPTHFLIRGITVIFPCSFLRTTDEVDNSWGFFSHGDLVGVLSSNFYYSNLHDALQNVSITMQSLRYKYYCRYRGFKTL